jgi:hypothetical protein
VHRFSHDVFLRRENAVSQLSKFYDKHLTTEGALHKDDPNSPPWWEEGATVEVDEETYLEYLEMLPPRFIDGDLFAFGEGSGSFTLFFMEHGRYFAHHLSIADTELFSELAGVSLLQ